MSQADPSAPVKTKEEETAVAEMPDDLHDDDEPTTEELVEMLREALLDVQEGRTRPFDELLCRLNAIAAEDAQEN